MARSLPARCGYASVPALTEWRIVKIQFKTLADLEKLEGGLVRRAFEKELRGIFEDLRERPALTKARDITLKLTFVPATDDSGTELTEVKIVPEVSSRRPPSRCRELSTRLVGTRHLVYDDLSPDNVHQQTMDLQPESEASSASGSPSD